MGRNLARNIAGHGRCAETEGFQVVAYNRTGSKTKALLADVKNEPEGGNIQGVGSYEALVKSVGQKGAYWLMVQSLGPEHRIDAVDKCIDRLTRLLRPGAIIIDGGNSFFKKTIRRGEELAKKRFMYVGTGVSGGEEGALKGPAIMPGGQRDAYNRIAPIMEAIAAKAPQDGTPCVSYIGPGGAGHFVKMVHNGIEYGDMGMIGEAVWTMRALLGWDFARIGKEMEKWNQPDDVLQSYLIEITADGLQEMQRGQSLVQWTADITRMKGTGVWTCQSANELLVPVPTIYAAVTSRMMSEQKELRLRMSKKLETPTLTLTRKTTRSLVDDIHDALYTAKISSYAQGIALLERASEKHEFDLNIGEIARGWRGGCIIRAHFLDDITKVYRAKKKPENLVAAPFFTKAVNSGLAKLARVTALAHQAGIPTPVLDASCNYLTQIASGVLVGASVNAQQRDYFGAHKYFKINKYGKLLKNRKGKNREFHTEWMVEGRPEKEMTD
jgi:6-phosphogluconate dehydrogenase